MRLPGRQLVERGTVRHPADAWSLLPQKYGASCHPVAAVGAGAVNLRRMARPTPSSSPRLARLRRRLAAYPWRRVGALAAISFLLSNSLIIYLFGFGDRFLSRLAGAFSVGFCLLSVTFLAAVPFIGWASRHWFGASWAGSTPPTPRRPASRPRNSQRSPTLP